MQRIFRVPAVTLISFLALGALSACGGVFVPSTAPQATDRSAQLPAADIGHTDPRKPIRVVVRLRYRHEAELERLVDTLEGTRTRRHLTRAEFMARFAPTATQEQRVLRALRDAGFRITGRYANRLLVDATAPSARVERLFATRFDDFRQRRYGVRAANVRPLRLPQALARDVAAVEANDLVLARTGFAGQVDATAMTAENAVRNGDFESGRLAPWESCGKATASIWLQNPESGSYDARTGSRTKVREGSGWSAICQRVIVPKGGVLSAWLSRRTNEPDMKYAYQEVALADATGKPAVVLGKSNVNAPAWTRESWSLAKYAGKTETLFFGVYGSGRKKYYDTQLVDNVALSPQPKATPTPVAGLSPSGGWGPSDTIAGLRLPAATGNTGAGQTAAIVIDALVARSDIDGYLKYFKIDRTGTISDESVDGGSSTIYEVEANLDLETIASLAPAANVIVYDVNELDNQEIEDAYNQVVSDGKATVVNSSFGECETLDPTFTSSTDAIALGAAAMGITFSASSGDTGTKCFDGATYARGVSAPASDPHFVGVGGTQAEKNPSSTAPAAGSIANPAVWNDPVGAGGGGVSTTWTTPPYQTAVQGVQSAGRNVPDIALPATHDALYYAGKWYLVWGTSWASPIYVAMQTEINEVCSSPQWGIDELYGAFAKTRYRHDFIDVVKGTNSIPGALGSSAFPGFDAVSGIGIPLGVPLATDTCGARANLSSP